HCDRTAEGVPHRDGAAGAGTGREVYGGAQVDRAAIEVVRFAVADPQGADTARRERLAETLVQTVRRAEEPAHGATARDDDPSRVARTVPEHGEQAAQCEDLHVTEARHQVDFLHGERVEQVERRGHQRSVRDGTGGRSPSLVARGPWRPAVVVVIAGSDGEAAPLSSG